jgi:flagellar basal body P-ring formation protein FlgA
MKPHYLLLGFCLIAPLCIPPAHAAALKTRTTLRGPQVYLRDLFEDAGANADRLLGPGPGPGGRIVVESRQLKAIARQYDVDWEPISHADRAVLEWPGRPLEREEVLAAVRAALVAQGAAADCDIVIPGFNPPIVPISGVSAPLITQLEFDRDLGRFTAMLSVTGDGMEPISTRLSGEVADVIELPVAVTRLTAGSIAGPDDIRVARVHVTSVHTEVAHDPAMVIGMQFKLQMQAGVPIPLSNLMQPTQINRGDAVRLQLQAGGLWLTGQGMALESGAVGDRIRVRNVSSQAVLEAEVIKPGEVRVLPGTLPITTQARSGITSARGG